MGALMCKLLFTTMALSLIAFASGCHDSGARPAPSATPEKPATGPVATTKPVPPAKPLKLAFVTNNASEFWKLAISGVRRSESETKTPVTVRMPSIGRVAEQNQILENLSEEGYDAIAVSVISAQEQTELLNKLSARTRLITFDADAPDSNRLVYVGTDNVMAGKTLGDEIVKLLPGGGKMGVFVGSFSAPNASQRLAGIRQAIKGKNIDIVVQLEDRTDRAKARANVEDVLTRHPDVKLLCGLWSYNGPAIAAALEGSGKNGKVLAVAFDEEQATLRAIETGTISVSIVQRPAELGYQACKWMERVAASPDGRGVELPKSRFVDVGVDVVTRNNVAECRKRLSEQLK